HEGRQQVIHKHWDDFTVSLRQNLDVLSMNTTTLLRDLFSGLLRLQSFTRDSTRFVAGELHNLEQEVRTIRAGISQVNNELDTLGKTEVTRVEKLSEITEQRLTLVKTPRFNVNGQISRILDNVSAEGLFPISQYLSKINDELVSPILLCVLTVVDVSQYHCFSDGSTKRSAHLLSRHRRRKLSTVRKASRCNIRYIHSDHFHERKNRT